MAGGQGGFAHRGGHHDLRNDRNLCVFRSDGVLGLRLLLRGSLCNIRRRMHHAFSVHLVVQNIEAKVGRSLFANPSVLCRFLRFLSTEAPSFHRSYPASSVQRASPPSQSARPASRELPVDPYPDHRWDFPCCVWSPLPACRRQYPGRSDGTCPLLPFQHLRPSHEPGRVGVKLAGMD